MTENINDTNDSEYKKDLNRMNNDIFISLFNKSSWISSLKEKVENNVVYKQASDVDRGFNDIRESFFKLMSKFDNRKYHELMVKANIIDKAYNELINLKIIDSRSTESLHTKFSTALTFRDSMKKYGNSLEKYQSFLASRSDGKIVWITEVGKRVKCSNKMKELYKQAVIAREDLKFIFTESHELIKNYNNDKYLELLEKAKVVDEIYNMFTKKWIITPMYTECIVSMIETMNDVHDDMMKKQKI